MITHNLIIRCDRCPIPVDNLLYNFVEERLENPTIDYFGYEVDNLPDYVDEEMDNEIRSSCYITFHFNHPQEIDQQTAIEFIKFAMTDDRIDRIESDGKDIDVVIL